MTAFQRRRKGTYTCTRHNIDFVRKGSFIWQEDGQQWNPDVLACPSCVAAAREKVAIELRRNRRGHRGYTALDHNKISPDWFADWPTFPVWSGRCQIG
jgi:hypothetical protein